MPQRPLPSSWNLYNLLGSPYFQETLEAGESSARPLTLFVGRTAELHQLRETIHGAGALSSRQAVAGVPGVGKTTLVQELKASMLATGYLSADTLVPIVAGDTIGGVFGRVLGALYDTILVNRPQSLDHPAMRAAQLLVRADRLSTGGANLAVLGFGAGVTRATTVVTPSDIMIDGPRIMRDLMALVRQSDARGVLLHLNNLENLSESDAAGAAEILRSLRDPMLLHDGLHYVVVGTTSAVNVVVNTHPQVRTVFSTVLLEPLEISDVHRLLAARYKHLRLHRSHPTVPPADADAVAGLYTLFRGDLRGLLKALKDGVSPLLGLAGTGVAEHAVDQHAAVRPLTLDELRPMLRQRYAAQLASLPERGRVEQLTRWGSRTPTSAQTQRSLSKLWGVTQGAVSTAITYLVRQGFVVALPRNGTEPTRYVLSGTGQLVFG